MNSQEIDLKAHWDKAYQNRQTSDLGWYEDNPEPTLKLIRSTELPLSASQLHVGVGSSTLLDHLLEEGHSGIIATDISASALEKLKTRLGDEAKKIDWIVEDLMNAQILQSLEPIDLWVDRAVLHFFTREADRKTYFDLLRSKLKMGGFVLIAAFNKKGAEICNGLPIHRYNSQMLDLELGPDFSRVESFDHTFVNPRGEDRPYIYTLYKRIR